MFDPRRSTAAVLFEIRRSYMKRRILPQLVAASVACLLAGAVNAAGVLAPDDDEDDLAPTGKGWGQRAYPAHPNGNANGQASRGGPKSSGIAYHGGPLMLGTTNVHYIWYGDWSGNSATTILTDLANNIGGSSYFKINTSYYDSSNKPVVNWVSYGGSTTDSYSRRTSLTDAAIQGIVASAITSNRLPMDSN